MQNFVPMNFMFDIYWFYVILQTMKELTWINRYMCLTLFWVEVPTSDESMKSVSMVSVF